MSIISHVEPGKAFVCYLCGIIMLLQMSGLIKGALRNGDSGFSGETRGGEEKRAVSFPFYLLLDYLYDFL